jgi:hypothetical protein
MKKVIFACMTFCLLASCNSTETKSSNAATTHSSKSSTATAASLTYAYTPTYSGDFEIGDPKYAQTILEIWKDYANNTYDNHKDAFADSVYIDYSGGGHFAGTRESLMSMMKDYITSVGTVTATAFAWTTLKPKGKDETLVCIWGKEVHEKNGKKDSVNVNQNWVFNKDGKISFLAEYEQKYAAGK